MFTLLNQTDKDFKIMYDGEKVLKYDFKVRNVSQ